MILILVILKIIIERILNISTNDELFQSISEGIRYPGLELLLFFLSKVGINIRYFRQSLFFRTRLRI